MSHSRVPGFNPEAIPDSVLLPLQIGEVRSGASSDWTTAVHVLSSWLHPASSPTHWEPLGEPISGGEYSCLLFYSVCLANK